MDKLQFHLPSFDGPLDLLLHLIRKHKLNIHDIEISALLEQYLNFLNDMQAENLEITSEFLEMAARLVYIKTCSLLPRQEEEKELKEQLTGELLQLDAVKRAADKLGEICVFGTDFSREPLELDEPSVYQNRHSVDELVEAYRLVSTKIKRRLPPPKSAFSGIVQRRIVSVTSRVIYLLKKLYRQKQIPYQEFFGSDNNSERVATFLAMLELIKSKRIRVNENNTMVEFVDR